MKFRILILLLHFSVFGVSQELLGSVSPENTDSARTSSQKFRADSLLKLNPSTDNEVFPKNFAPKFQSKYRGSDFDYSTVKPKQSLWQKISLGFRRILESIFGEVDPMKAFSITKIFLKVAVLVIIAVVLFILIKFWRRKEGNLFFAKKNKKIRISGNETNENIHVINFSESIEKLEQKKDYRSAVRYHFLSVLKKLTDQKILKWTAEKTNNDYLNELKNTGLEGVFSELVRIYDYVWYGEFEVNEERYLRFKQKFVNFKP